MNCESWPPDKVQRIFGLCFDQDQEISVSGISKLGELDSPINDAFFELTPIDLRNVDKNITNTQNGVIQFLECNDVDIPVDSTAIIDALNELNFVEGEEAEKRAEFEPDLEQAEEIRREITDIEGEIVELEEEKEFEEEIPVVEKKSNLFYIVISIVIVIVLFILYFPFIIFVLKYLKYSFLKYVFSGNFFKYQK